MVLLKCVQAVPNWMGTNGKIFTYGRCDVADFTIMSSILAHFLMPQAELNYLF